MSATTDSSLRQQPQEISIVPKYTLLTGATGLVGRYLTRDLLWSGHRLALLVRPSRAETAQERVEGIMQPWEQAIGQPLPRPVVLAGDLCRNDIGLTSNDRRWIAAHCDRVLHNAAALTFHSAARDDEPWRTNLHGTQNLLGLCRELKLRELHYVSTAYVCGARQGVIRESELDEGQSFRNDYEESKFLAEKAVRSAGFLDRPTIYRPAVIAGDSATGYTSTYHGLYVYMRLVSLLVANTRPDANGVRNIPLRLNLTGKEGRNVVPVDWVSATITRLLTEPAARGGTYHLAPQCQITASHVAQYCKTFWNGNDVDFCGDRPIQAEMMNDLEKSFVANSIIYGSYETTDPQFDMTNLQRLVPDFPCPAIDEAMMHRFLKYGEEDRWGKRRQFKPKVEFWVEDYLRSLIERAGPGPSPLYSQIHKTLLDATPYGEDSTSAVGPRHTVNGAPHESLESTAKLAIGLDIHGRGGGQWTLHLIGQKAVQLESGLPEGAPVLSLPSRDILAMAALPTMQATR